MKTKIAGLLLALCLLAAAGLYYLLDSENGLRRLAGAVEKLSGPAFSVEQVEGRLLSGWRLKNLKLDTPVADISCGLLSLDWRAARILNGTLQIVGINLKDVVVALKKVEKDTPQVADASFALPQGLLPFPLFIDRFDVAGLKVLLPDGSLLTDIHQFGLKFSGDQRRLEITSGLLAADRYGLQLHGFVQTDGRWTADLMGSWRINPPQYAEMGGTFSVRGPLERLRVEAAADRPGDVRLSGTLHDFPQNPHWQARAEGWQVWFPVFYPTWPELRLSAVVEAAGDFGRYHGTVRARGSFLDYDDITGIADVDGDHAGLTARSLHLSSADGEVQIDNMALAWLNGFRWRGDVRTSDFNPAGFDERIIGILTADLTSEGFIGYEDGDQLQTSTDIRSLAGTVRDFPVTGKGKVSSLHTRFEVQDLFLQSGASFLQAAGVLGETYDLTFDMASPDIGEILPDGEGEISARGRIGGSRQYPLFDLDLDAAGVRYGTEKMERLTARIHADTQPGTDMTATIEGEEITLSFLTVHSGRIELAGSAGDHSLQGRFTTDRGDLRLALHGALRDMQWQGQARDLQLNLAAGGSWLQQETASLDISEEGVTIAGLCLGREESRACLAGNWQSKEGKPLWRAEGSLRELSLDFLEENNLTDLPVHGIVEASLSLVGDDERIISGDLTAAVPQTHIELGLAEEGFDHLSLSGTTLQLHLADQRLQGSVQSNFQDKSSVALQVAIDQAGIFSQPFWLKPLQGELLIDMRDLSPFAALTDFVMRPTGRLNSVLSIGGTLSHPLLSGQLDLREGRIALPSLGIFLQDVGVSLSATDEGIAMQGTARSGPGRVKADGILTYYEGAEIQGDFQIIGEQFEVVSLPEYEIRINPDVNFRFNREKGELNGSIHVPQALLTPKEMKDALSVSDDVIYIDHKEGDKVSRWPIETDLQVSLGDDVRVDGYGLKGRLIGSLAVRNTTDAFMSGRGELTLQEGVFSIYGRSLAIERGRILFSGGPVDNPVIDARALQSIKGKSAVGDDLVVGVTASGNLQDLDFKLFSDPSMDESDILAYMVVGHSRSGSNKDEESLLEAAASVFGLEEGAGMVNTLADLLPVDEMHLEGTGEEGTMSLVVGKKLTDKLHIGYDHNFFDQKGEFRVSYDLGYGFSAVTRSSASSNGADIFYTIEK